MIGKVDAASVKEEEEEEEEKNKKKNKKKKKKIRITDETDVGEINFGPAVSHLRPAFISNKINALTFDQSRRKLSDVIIGPLQDTGATTSFNLPPFFPLHRANVALSRRVISFVHFIPLPPHSFFLLPR